LSQPRLAELVAFLANPANEVTVNGTTEFIEDVAGLCDLIEQEGGITED
jgi:hypothetical protein